MSDQVIRVAHSPDPDDAFMFYALANGKIDTSDLDFSHTLQDIETLNRKAFEGFYEVTAISFHAYAYVADRYALMPAGASIGNRYGPLIVAAEPFDLRDLKNKIIAVPGTMTTAFLVLRMIEPEVRYQVVPFDGILEEVTARRVDAGLIIHEGQLTYGAGGLHKIIDLGEWWYQQTQLPLPLGGNGIRKDLGREASQRISQLIRQSIEYGLAHRDEALRYALQYARGMDTSLADRFVGMYVNEFTLDYGPRGRAGLQALYDWSHRKGLIPHTVPLDFL
ncbi:MAG: ABC transporter substrate-binding protein [Acidobacteria bacterium]|nr:ABC transporter substrate-binding protein [Acidobacteriota bacterium]MBI3656510.1 ABC transporter substrate-binding protein [Acidobacteriota bacterium]